MTRKRKQQFGKMVKFRSYQFMGIAFAMFFYLVIYRKFLHPKSVHNSLVYNQAITFIKESSKIRREIGAEFQIMTCNGKIYPFKNDINFDLVIYGSEQKARVDVRCDFNKADQLWSLAKIGLTTKDSFTKIL